MDNAVAQRVSKGGGDGLRGGREGQAPVEGGRASGDEERMDGSLSGGEGVCYFAPPGQYRKPEPSAVSCSVVV